MNQTRFQARARSLARAQTLTVGRPPANMNSFINTTRHHTEHRTGQHRTLQQICTQTHKHAADTFSFCFLLVSTFYSVIILILLANNNLISLALN